MKVLFLTNIPSPYRVDFFNELGKNCELTVLFERNDANNRNHKWLQNKNQFYDAVFLKGMKIGSDSAICFEVLKYLDKRKFDIIIVGGYSTFTGIIAISYLHQKKIPFILNSDGGFIKENENTIKRLIKKHFISSATSWLSTGKTTEDWLVHYGAKADKIFRYPFTSLTNEDLMDKIISEEEKSRLKSNLNIKEDKVILTVGRFINIKGFDVLLKSCTKIPSNCGVYIIGGEPTQEYLELKDILKLGDNIHFVKFKSKDELKKYYSVSDLFVLPTRGDVWGLVINEAMEHGLPIITTYKCIAGLELVKDYDNGFIVPVDDVKQLSEKMNIILFDDDLRKRMAQRSLDKISEYTVENMAKVHMSILDDFMGKGRKNE